MDRRTLIASGLITLGAAGLARAQQSTSLPPARPRDAAAPPPPNSTPSYPTAGPSGDTTGKPEVAQTTYSEDEIVHGVSDFLGVTAESAGGAVERVFKSNGRPTAYVAGKACRASSTHSRKVCYEILCRKRKNTMDNSLKIALVIAAALITGEGVWIYFSPFHTCVRANPDAIAQVNWCTRAANSWGSSG